jgi:hypothetical protein
MACRGESLPSARGWVEIRPLTIAVLSAHAATVPKRADLGEKLYGYETFAATHAGQTGCPQIRGKINRDVCSQRGRLQSRGLRPNDHLHPKLKRVTTLNICDIAIRCYKPTR